MTDTTITPTGDPLLLVADVAARLRVNPYTVRRWCSTGELRAIRLAREWRIPASSFDAFLAARTTAASA